MYFKLKTVFIISIFLSATIFAAVDICEKPSFTEDIASLTTYINNDKSEAVRIKNLHADQLATNQILQTKINEILIISQQTPFPVRYTLYPNSTLKVLELPSQKCGLRLKVNEGKVSSEGTHPVQSECEEVETEEVAIQPEGTAYMVETGALTAALAESDDELAGGTQRGASSYHENLSVSSGSIKVRLKKAAKAGTKIKYSKVAKNSKNKDKKTKLAKNKIKTTTKTLAYNEKIKLKTGSSLKIKRNKKEKRQVAELEVVELE